jgi:hypothetical protein
MNMNMYGEYLYVHIQCIYNMHTQCMCIYNAYTICIYNVCAYTKAMHIQCMCIYNVCAYTKAMHIQCMCIYESKKKNMLHLYVHCTVTCWTYIYTHIHLYVYIWKTCCTCIYTVPSPAEHTWITNDGYILMRTFIHMHTTLTYTKAWRKTCYT